MLYSHIRPRRGVSIGSLDITNGGSVVSGYNASIGGYTNLGVGTVTVDGVDSSLSSIVLMVGEKGKGTLNITNGGSVSNDWGDCTIGSEAGSEGTLTVNGTGSTLTSDDDLFVGKYGKGTLEIQAGAVVTNDKAYIGRYAGSQAAVTVTGAGSNWTSTSDLYVGYDAASSTLDIKNGGNVSCYRGYIGYSAGSDSTVTIDGVGSLWTVTDYYNGIYIGIDGSGTLSIRNGGGVSSKICSIGRNAGATGTVTVEGAGTVWNNGLTIVGFDGTGSLSISGGGSVIDTTGSLGARAGSSGTATVDGTDSTWSNSSDLYVGGSGVGSLSVLNGATITSKGESARLHQFYKRGEFPLAVVHCCATYRA
ncbi:MAG: hypothetical protein GWP14_08215 [Actinobacteria bacterium]|nr:hypothetical protein [Actinomycetota bacterium]